MSIKIMSWVWDNSPYDGKALLLHLALADFANDNGECWPSQTTLAKKARCTDRHVRNTVLQMVEDGYLEITTPSNGVDSHRYTLTTGPRNSVPPRKSKTGRPEIQDRETGNPPPKNRQEPSGTSKCPYCRTSTGAHYCPAMNMRIK